MKRLQYGFVFGHRSFAVPNFPTALGFLGMELLNCLEDGGLSRSWFPSCHHQCWNLTKWHRLNARVGWRIPIPVAQRVGGVIHVDAHVES